MILKAKMLKQVPIMNERNIFLKFPVYDVLDVLLSGWVGKDDDCAELMI